MGLHLGGQLQPDLVAIVGGLVLLTKATSRVGPPIVAVLPRVGLLELTALQPLIITPDAPVYLAGIAIPGNEALKLTAA